MPRYVTVKDYGIAHLSGSSPDKSVRISGEDDLPPFNQQDIDAGAGCGFPYAPVGRDYRVFINDHAAAFGISLSNVYFSLAFFSDGF